MLDDPSQWPAAPEAGSGFEINGSLGVATRVYFEDAPFSNQDVGHVSPYLFGRVNARYSFGPNDRIEAEIYGRAVPFSEGLIDARELFYIHTANSWDFLLGVDTVSWGVAESFNPVDIINQKDTRGELNGVDDRLGQPMANLNLQSSRWGNISLYGLVGFREQDFAEADDRVRPIYTVDEGDASFGGEDWEKEVNLAARYTNNLSTQIGNFDFGLSYFHGLNRDPRLVAKTNSGSLEVDVGEVYEILRDLDDEFDGSPAWEAIKDYIENLDPNDPAYQVADALVDVVPRYEVLDQVGIEALYSFRNLQLKFEGASRWENDEHYYSTVTGVEYTIADAFNGAADIGLLAEYLYDGRSVHQPFTPFEDDVFIATRLTLNNAASTRMLAGVIVDVDDKGTFGTLKIEHRLQDDLLFTLDSKAFLDLPFGDPYRFLENESYVKIGFEKFF